MKKHEITTSKGEFVVVELPKEVKSVQDIFCEAILATHYNGYIETYYPFEDESGFELKLILKLSEATEEDSKGVVDTHVSESINTHLMKLHYVLKSKGIDINNGNWYLFNKI